MKQLTVLLLVASFASCKNNNTPVAIHDTVIIVKHDTISVGLDPEQMLRQVAQQQAGICNTWFRNGYYTAQNAMIDLYNADNVTEQSVTNRRYKEFNKASALINSIR